MSQAFPQQPPNHVLVVVFDDFIKMAYLMLETTRLNTHQLCDSNYFVDSVKNKWIYKFH